MTKEKLQVLKADFITWSGGFEPDSIYEIEVYTLYARPVDAVEEDECREALRRWMDGPDQEARQFVFENEDEIRTMAVNELKEFAGRAGFDSRERLESFQKALREVGVNCPVIENARIRE